MKPWTYSLTITTYSQYEMQEYTSNIVHKVWIKKLKLILTVDYDVQPQWQRISVHISGMNASKFKGQHLSLKKLLWTKYNFKTATLYLLTF